MPDGILEDTIIPIEMILTRDLSNHVAKVKERLAKFGYQGVDLWYVFQEFPTQDTPKGNIEAQVMVEIGYNSSPNGRGTQLDIGYLLSEYGVKEGKLNDFSEEIDKILGTKLGMKRQDDISFF